MNIFKKSNVVGVAVTPERGLEVAEINFNTKTITKYASKPLAFNVNNCQIADLDIFKESLQDILNDLNISKDSRIVLSIPTGIYRITDYPAVLSPLEIESAVEEELLSHPLFSQNQDPCFSIAQLKSSSNQFNRVIYTASQHSMISELVYSVRSLGYKIYAIDSSANSIFNTLNYVGRFDNVSSDTSWVLMVVDNISCRITTLIGNEYTDVFEERISIGEILGEEENYSTVISTAEPILKNLPSKFLYIVSTTDLISAEKLAGKIQYSSQIIHQEANSYSNEVLLNIAPTVDPEIASNISLEVIGAAIRREIEPYSNFNMNLYNKSLGELYFADQPPKLGNLVLSDELLAKIFLLIFIILFAMLAVVFFLVSLQNKAKEAEYARMKNENEKLVAYIEKNKEYLEDKFNEGLQVKQGLNHNKSIYSYYTIVGTEIPQKLWLTHLKLSDKTTIEGQADNVESIYSFFRNVKDYNPEDGMKLQKLTLATQASNNEINKEGAFDTESVLTSLNADFYEFMISNETVIAPETKNTSKSGNLPDLEPIKE